MTLRLLRFVLRLAERRGYERGLAARPEFVVDVRPTVTLPDGSTVTSTGTGPLAEDLLRRLYPDAFRD
jgi:hypothetical protein